MALLNKKDGSSNIIYLSVVGGELRQRVQEGTEGCLTRTTKEGKTVYEKTYGGLIGIVTDVKVQYNDVIKAEELMVNLEDVGEKYVIRFNFNTDFAQNFIDKLPNIPHGRHIYIDPYSFDDKEKKDKDGNPKKIKGITIKVDNDKGEAITRFFTRKEPNGFPMLQDGIDFKDPKNKKVISNWKIDTDDFRRSVVENNRVRFASFVPSKQENLEDNQHNDDLPF